MALEADFKFYTGSVPTTSVVPSKLGTVLEPRLGSLKGLPEVAPPGANQDMIRAIARQNESAGLLAQRGLNVEYLPNTGKPGPNPDLSINGNTADVYSPYSKNPNTIRENIAYKVENQASNIVLNLSDSPLSSNEIIRFLQENPVEGLRQLYTIKHSEVILRNWK
jgi:filamentous hemagglutinin